MKAFTHAGQFHADDVFSAALLKIIYPDIKIIRGNEVPENFDGIVFDIGFGEFDHHQKNNEIRKNGIPYASFGKLWRKFGPELVSQRSVVKIDKCLCSLIDNSDNTGKFDTLATAIKSMNASWNDNSDNYSEFLSAVNVAKTLLLATIKRINNEELAENYLKTAVLNNNNGIVVLKKFVPWKTLIGTDIKFVIYPANRGGYNAQIVADINHPATWGFPPEWYGLTKESLVEVSGIKELNFCHSSGFVLNASTLESAINACYSAVDFT